MRQAAAVEHLRPCGHRRPRGIEDTRPQPYLTRAEHGNPVRVRCPSAGKPTVRESRIPWREQDAQEAKAGGRKAAGNRDGMAGPPGGRSRITGRIPGLVPGCESRLTCGG